MAEWKDLDWVRVRSNQGHLAHVLRMEKYQSPLKRLQMDRNPLADFLYITNRIWMGTPSKRLQARADVPHSLGRMRASAPAVCTGLTPLRHGGASCRVHADPMSTGCVLVSRAEGFLCNVLGSDGGPLQATAASHGTIRQLQCCNPNPD